MDVVSVCPLRVASLRWQPRPGAWTLTVICKATYELTPGEAKLADPQEDPNEDDNYWDDDASRSLYAPRDVVPFKPRADVILVGHAFAARREPVRALVARVIVGEINKAIEVFGERSWMEDGLLREGPPFVKVPMRYERAAWGPDNPVGVRADARPDGHGATPLPNLQPPGTRVASRRDVIEPVGFGPIAPIWPARAGLLARGAVVWPTEVWSTQPMPEGIDTGYFNVAPRDQRLDTLRPDERIVLENLHPVHARLLTHLPGVFPYALAERGGGQPEVIPMRADTLWIDTDRSLCTLTWRGHIRLDAASPAGRVTISAKGGSRRSWPDFEGALADAAREGAGLRAATPDARATPDPTETVGMAVQGPREGPAMRPVLPFVQSPGDGEALAYSRTPRPFADIPPLAGPGDTIPALRADVHVAPPLPFPEASARAGLPDTSQTPVPSPGHVSVPPLIQPLLVGVGPRTTDAGSGASPPIVPESPWAGAPGRPPPLTIGQGGMPAADGAAKVPPPDLVRPVSPGPDACPPAFQLPRSGNDSPDGHRTGSTATPPARPKVGSLASLRRASSKGGEIPGGPSSAPTPGAGAGQEQLASAPRSSPAAVVELLWHDPASSDAIRAEPRWRALLGDVKPKSRDADTAESALPAKRQEAKDRREIAAILARGDPALVDELSGTLASAVDEDGRFVPPLVLLAGEIEFPFDEFETLKATIAAVTPLVAGDKKLKDVVDTMSELLRTPWIHGASSVTEGLTNQIKEAFAQGNRILPPRYLEAHTERILLEQRHYQKRAVLGQPWIRSIFTPASSSQAIPTYLPVDVTRALPMFQRLHVLLLAELHIQLDQYESHPNALRVVALGRVLRSASRR